MKGERTRSTAGSRAVGYCRGIYGTLGPLANIRDATNRPGLKEQRFLDTFRLVPFPLVSLAQE